MLTREPAKGVSRFASSMQSDLAYPAYRRLLSGSAFEEIETRALERLRSCNLCPRNCGVDRLKGELGFCRGPRLAKVSSYGPHFGEERPLVGRNGSGTIFFTGCNLRCCFCQNYDISHFDRGREVTAPELAEMMLALEAGGCHNINLVTPTHFVPQIISSLKIAASMGLSIPVVYNCGGYEAIETLRLLEGIVDIYMPDFKFMSQASSKRYLNASDYPQVAKAALKEMHRQVGDLVIKDGIALRGLLVRHLVMPSHLDDSREIFRLIATEISPSTFVNVMDQYRPCHEADRFPEIARRISVEEFERALDYARKEGLERIYC